MRFCDRRTHDDTSRWAAEALESEVDHVMGIMGESVFFEAESFDVVHDMQPDPMHLLDLGFMKNTCGRTFHCGGANPQTLAGYRRSPVGKLNDLVK